jgi:hypothetical protein
VDPHSGEAQRQWKRDDLHNLLVEATDAFDDLMALEPDTIAVKRFMSTGTELRAASEPSMPWLRSAPPPARAAGALGEALGDLAAQQEVSREAGLQRELALLQAQRARTALADANKALGGERRIGSSKEERAIRWRRPRRTAEAMRAGWAGAQDAVVDSASADDEVKPT